MPKAAASPPPAPVSYEAALQELEALVGQMESGQMPLDGLLTGYRRGAELLQFCRGRLDAVEDQIRVLDQQGQIKPWSAE
ncbi:exodeoxyribonuclease VII small subunit [Pseudorhodoferax soli]|jgi:exodeoxyribonuclease VII small subunit|uniref:Exodeoxyribonuclease 7 small subunit n=1 Tax=Pseudorhodoferax soli TaxID=545864 RepID=A0A368XYM3_9BURK|nr:exodeoxyribonuclease VII small subunit [Pseudorhodoferax soli]RCW72965.1 exodeoxyribonuclease VII small subunit [Pseudorhodoferax soli]